MPERHNRNSVRKSARADAVLHRQQLLIAAKSVFAEHGVFAPLELVILRANVGRATLYRNFADRKALMYALLDEELRSYESYVAKLADRPDALWMAFDYAVNAIIVSSAALVAYWRSLDRNDPAVVKFYKRHVQIYRRPLEICIEAGQCRADLKPADIVLAVRMLTSELGGRSVRERQRLARRAMKLLKRGLMC